MTKSAIKKYTERLGFFGMILHYIGRFMTKTEQQALKDLVALDPKTCMQQVPNDEQKLVKDVLDKLKDTKGL